MRTSLSRRVVIVATAGLVCLASSCSSSSDLATDQVTVPDLRAEYELVAICLKDAGWDAQVVNDLTGFELQTYGVETREDAEAQFAAEQACRSELAADGKLTDFDNPSEDLVRLFHADAVYTSDCLQKAGFNALAIPSLEVVLSDSSANLNPYDMEGYIEAGISPEEVLTACPAEVGVSQG